VGESEREQEEVVGAERAGQRSSERSVVSKEALRGEKTGGERNVLKKKGNNQTEGGNRKIV